MTYTQRIYSFLERGSDERQYNSPGVDLPISSIFRTMYGKYPEYHTSLDNFNLVTPKGISGGFLVAKTSINLLLKKIIPKNLILCEPQMGKRKLYPTLSIKGGSESARAYMNFLQYADGKNDFMNGVFEIFTLSFIEVEFVYKRSYKTESVGNVTIDFSCNNSLGP